MRSKITAFVLITVCCSKIVSMDSMQIDNQENPTDDWIHLDTSYKLTPLDTNDREKNLELVISNLLSNTEKIPSLTYVPQQDKSQIVEKLFSLIDRARILKSHLAEINALAPENQKILLKQIDSFSDADFEQHQKIFSRQRKEARSKKNTIQQNDEQPLLDKFKKFTVNNT